MEELIAKRYAKALYASGINIDEAIAALDAIKTSMLSSEIKEKFLSPIVKTADKLTWLTDALAGADERLINFVKLLAEKNRLDLIPAVAKVLHADLQKAFNRYEGVVESDTKVSDKEIERLEKALSSYSGAEISLKPIESEREGLFVKVEDLGLEVSFSKNRVKETLVDFIKQAL